MIAYIGLGSNLGDSVSVVRDAWKELGTQPGIHLKDLSSPYRTEPVGMTSSNWFVNAVGSIHTSLGPEEILDRLLSIELQFGRKRIPGRERYQDRSLDLDLLFFNSLEYSGDRLHIPHPELHKRLFVLYPLSDIAPDYVHPTLKKTVAELLSEKIGEQKRAGIEKITWTGI